AAFGRAHENPAHGYLHPVDLAEAQLQHDAFCEVLTGLGVAVHELATETESPDLVYTYDPALVTDRGMIALRSGKPNREGEEAGLADWAEDDDLPIRGRVVVPPS